MIDLMFYFLKGFLLLGIMAVIYWAIVKHQNNKNFQRFMRPGMYCYFYRDEERVCGVIRKVTGNKVTLDSIYGPVTINKEELYV